MRERVLGGVGGRVLQRLITSRATAVHPDLGFPEVVVPRRELTVPTAAGPAPVSVYEPAGDDPSRGPRRVHVNFHGGGYVMGNPDQDDALCRCLAADAGVVVLNVDYVLAPQHPFPAAVHQAFEVVRWVHGNAAAQGWDGAAISVGGQSAGGGLAAAVARQSLTAGGPPIALQVLQYPPLDLVTDTAAKPAVAPKAVISPGLAGLFNAAYAPDPAQRRDPLASPVLSTPEQLRGIAPAVVVTAELDRLHDEAVRYVELLRAADVPVEHRDLPGVDHAYDLSGVGTSPAAVREVHGWLAEQIAAAHRDV